MMNLPFFVGHCTLRQRHQLPNSPGIYFVTDERDRLLYIGKAKNLRLRWAGIAHHRYKQLARKGLDKIKVSYILVNIDELDKLEREYIEQLYSLLNNTKVNQYLPKKSPRISELQRLLKLSSTPLFPSCKFTTDSNGKTLPRSDWHLLRGFIAGTYIEDNRPYVVVVCQQNMGQLLWRSSNHRSKKRFYLSTAFERIPGWCFDARQAIFVFVEFFILGDCFFEQLYPNFVECKVAGVALKKLPEPTCLIQAIQSLPTNEDKAVVDYLVNIYSHLQPLSADFTLNEQVIW